MQVNPQSVKMRWKRIRENKACELALDPESVAKYLNIPESELVRHRIHESLAQLVLYRLETKSFASYEPDSPGELATCEGLEAFLVPAVEGALPFSTFLKALAGNNNENLEVRKQFIEAIKGDIQGLLAQWIDGKFSGEPYANNKKIQKAVLLKLRNDFKQINITEAAAMACRVLIHLLTLKLNRPEEDILQKEIGKDLDDESLFIALTKAIDYLIQAFQKGPGEDLGTQIASSTFGNAAGSGWSWTSWPGLPPMLFFTAAAVDAFAELDLYLIRFALNKDSARTPQAEKLRNYYEKVADKLELFQLCVEMARKWVQDTVLPDLSWGYGQYSESKDSLAKEPDGSAKQKEYEMFQEDLDRLGLAHPPMVFYNSLYTLLILLWSWGDWSDDGTITDDAVKSQINRALAQLVYNYDSLPVVKEILNRFSYKFYLPGPDVFNPQEERYAYLDSAFLPMLTRLLVLFVVYGVGDRNLLEPVIRDLYVELLQNRTRKVPEFTALWSAEGVEVFSTQRAIQALTFYYAYARGKEIVERSNSSIGDISFRNETGIRLVLKAVKEGPDEYGKPRDTERVEKPGDEQSAPVIQPPVDQIKESSFNEYRKQNFPDLGLPPLSQHDDTQQLLIKIKALGDSIMTDLNEKRIRDHSAARILLNALARISADPETKDAPREAEFSLLKGQYQDLLERTAAGKAE